MALLVNFSYIGNLSRRLGSISDAPHRSLGYESRGCCPLSASVSYRLSFSLQVALAELPRAQYLNKDLKLKCYPDIFNGLSPLMLFSMLFPPLYCKAATF